jgi:hypothetical protein
MPSPRIQILDGGISNGSANGFSLSESLESSWLPKPHLIDQFFTCFGAFMPAILL